mmetsp:Transcript_47453/g.152013  ORF Transcript_47453/g.152013 Transcript_47453/m.152013 type:complete len:313 (-) Transcript_47453:150-1088(-)
MASMISIKWQSKEFPVQCEEGWTVEDLKRRIEEETQVQPKRQKLLGLKLHGKPPGDDAKIGDLSVAKKVIMMGTPEEVIAAQAVQAAVAPEVVDDFDIGDEDAPINVVEDPDNHRKIQKRVDNVKVSILNPPREGKKCLVLDIDYTLFDHRSTAEVPKELERPYLHEFLTAAYAEYDIVIWSATGMRWVEVKMRELGVLSNPNYKVAFMLDHSAMITVTTEKYGVFDCKPLQFIWSKYPEHYSSANTIMFDDLRRNFVMNPQNGLKIRPFRKAHLNRETDKELLHLTRYLLAISKLEDLSPLNHKRWESFRE